MELQKMKFDELLLDYEKVIVDAGLGYSSRLQMLKEAAGLIKRHEELGLARFDESVIAEYYQHIDQRRYDGRSKRSATQGRVRNVQKFMYFCEHGILSPSYQMKGSTYKLTPEYQNISDAYLASGDFHPNTKNDMRWVAHKYFTWLAEQGYVDIKNVGVAQLQDFLLHCSKLHPGTSMHNIKLHMKKLYLYLYTAELSKSHYAELLSFRVNRESKIYPALPMDTVKKLLDTIDRRTKKGKRNYAAMVLGAELGLRACDVANLKLGDIEWMRGELKFKQLKTGNTVVLPLTEKVGEAIRDYILNARPQNNEQHIFLRLNKPYKPLKSAVTIGEIYEACCKSAGTTVSKSFHTLRRSLATAMVTNGVEITDVAQVLGDSKIESTKKYISLDSHHLKQCALSFENIAPKVSQNIDENNVGGDTQ